MEAYSKEFRRDVLAACDAGRHAQVALGSTCRNRGSGGSSRSVASRGRWLPRRRALDADVGALRGLDPGEAGPPARHLSPRAAGGRAGRTRLAGLGRDAEPGVPGAAAHAKKKTLIAVEQDRDDVVEARRQWAADQFSIDPDRVVFIDETWAKTNMTRTYGRSSAGRAAAGEGALRPMGNDDLPRSDAFDRLRRAAVRRGGHQRPSLPGLGRAASGQDASSPATWSSWTTSPATSAPRRAAIEASRRRSPLLAALLARSQSDRTGLQQVQEAPPRRRRANHRQALATLRQSPRPVHRNRMPKLPPTLRIPLQLADNRTNVH